MKKQKSNEAFEDAPESIDSIDHKPIRGKQKVSANSKINGVTPKREPCPCGCGKIPEGRQGKVYYNRHHKDNHYNRMRLEAIKHLAALRKIHRHVLDVLDDIYGPV